MRRAHVIALAVLAVVLAATVAGVAAGVARHHRDAARYADRVQGPPLHRATVVTHDGTRIKCPMGSEPYLFINDAYFTPKLHLGTTFVPGQYRVRLTGTVANETTSAIVIDQIRPHVGTQIWRHARVIAPAALKANSSGRLTIVGVYRVRHVQPASVSGTLGWHWQQRSLKPCLSRGLIQDD